MYKYIYDVNIKLFAEYILALFHTFTVRIQDKMSKFSRLFKRNFSTTKLMFIKKSFEEHNPILSYCQKMSSPLPAVLRNLQEETLKLNNSRMMSSPEVLSLIMFLIKAVRAKKVIDVGVFTGCSSLASAIAVGDGGRVIALEKSLKNVETARYESFT